MTNDEAITNQEYMQYMVNLMKQMNEETERAMRVQRDEFEKSLAHLYKIRGLTQPQDEMVG